MKGGAGPGDDALGLAPFCLSRATTSLRRLEWRDFLARDLSATVCPIRPLAYLAFTGVASREGFPPRGGCSGEALHATGALPVRLLGPVPGVQIPVANCDGESLVGALTASSPAVYRDGDPLQ